MFCIRYSDGLEIDFTLNICTQGKRSNGFFLDVSSVSLHANMIPSVTVDQENFSLVNKLVVNLQVTRYKLKHCNIDPNGFDKFVHL